MYTYISTKKKDGCHVTPIIPYAETQNPKPMKRSKTQNPTLKPKTRNLCRNPKP